MFFRHLRFRILIDRIIISGIILLIPILSFSNSVSWSDSVLSRQTQEMTKLRSDARDHLAKRKNNLALESLKSYHKAMVNDINEQEVSATQHSVRSFIIEQKKRQDSIRLKESRIAELRSQSGTIESENSSLARKALLYIALIMGIGSSLLFNRMKRLSLLEKALEVSAKQKQFVQERLNWIPEGRAKLHERFGSFNEIANKLLNLKPLSDLSHQSRQLENPRKAVHFLNKVKSSINAINAASEFSDKMNIEPQFELSNLNELIEEMSLLIISYKKADVAPVIVKDLEDILPQVHLDRERVRFVLFHLLSNATDAVIKKALKDLPGYTPTITITSRKLPRFIQVRIKDNGVGINKKELDNIFDAFYSGKPGVDSVGVGLTKCNEIMTELHKGELMVESDEGDGSDFIMRFPFNQNMI